MNEHLDDKETYEVIDNKEQAITGVIGTIEDWTEKYANEPAWYSMTPKINTWIIPTTDNEAGNMYVNPKAHKPDKNYHIQVVLSAQVFRPIQRTCRYSQLMN